MGMVSTEMLSGSNMLPGLHHKVAPAAPSLHQREPDRNRSPDQEESLVILVGFLWAYDNR